MSTKSQFPKFFLGMVYTLTLTHQKRLRLVNLDPYPPKWTAIGQFWPLHTKIDLDWSIWTLTHQNRPWLVNLDPYPPKTTTIGQFRPLPIKIDLDWSICTLTHQNRPWLVDLDLHRPKWTAFTFQRGLFISYFVSFWRQISRVAIDQKYEIIVWLI